MRFNLKIASIILGAIITFLAILLLLLSMGVFNSKIARSLSRITSQQINGSLTIAEIEGNLLSHFFIRNVHILQNDKVVLDLEELEIDYNPWKIIRKNLQADIVHISGIRIFLVEEADGLWNLQKLLVPAQTTPVDTMAQTFPWNIDLADIQIIKLEVHTETLDSLKVIPRMLKLDASFNVAFNNKFKQLNLLHLELITQEPKLHINQIAFQAGINDSVITWNDFELRLLHSAIHSKGSIPLNAPHLSEVSLNASPFHFDDLTDWLPAIHGNPEINLQISNEGKFSHINFNLIQDNQSLAIQGRLSDINGLPSYSFQVDVDSINGEYWTHEPEYKSNIKGQLEVNGQGFNFRENRINVRAQFADLKYENYEIIDFLLFLVKDNELLEGKVKANTIFGTLDSEIHVKNIFNSPVYDAVIQLNQLNLAKLTLNEKLESSINLEFQANGKGFVPGEIEADLRIKSNSSVLFDQPITDFDSKIALNLDEYKIEGFRLETPHLLASISGDGNLSKHNRLQFIIKAKNIEEIADAFGLDPIHFEGEIDGSFSGPANALALSADIQIADLRTDSLVLRDVSSQLSSLLSFKLQNTGIKSISTDNKDSLITLKNLYLKTETHAVFAAYGKYYLEETMVNMEKNEETLVGKLTSNTMFGFIESQFNIGQIFSVPEYQLKTYLTNLDLSKITNNKDYRSDINLEITLEGIGIESESLRAGLALQSEGSSIFGCPVEDFDASIYIEEKNYLLENFLIETPFVVASLTGSGHWIYNNNLVFDLKTKDMRNFPPVFGPDNMQFSAQMNGRVSGSSDSLDISSALNIENLRYDTIHVEQITADAAVQIADSAYSGILNVRLFDSRIQDFKLSKVEFASNFSQDKALNSLAFFANDSLNGNILSDVYFGNNPTFFIPEIVLNYQGNLWTGGGDESYIRFGEDSIEINQIALTSGASAIKTNGIFAFRGSEDLHFEMKNFKLISIPGLHLFPYPISGNVNSVLDMTGTAEHPIIKGNIDIVKLEVDTLSFSRFYAAFDYANENLTLDSYLNDYNAQLLKANMELPLHISFSDSIFLPGENNPIHADIKIDQLYLNRFNGFVPLRGFETNGLLNANVSISNTLHDPFVNGMLNLSEGEFIYKKLGINYENIELSSHFNNTLFYLDSLHILSGDGYLKLEGSVNMDSVFSGEVRDLKLNLKGKNFKAFDSDMLRAVINTNLDLMGNPENPVFRGKLSVLRSTLNTDLLLKEFNRVPETDKPMLVLAQSEAENIDLYQVTKNDTTRKPPPDMYKNLTGQFDIEIPRNTWIKGKNMNFELAGTIKAIKEGEQIDLFGSMLVKRGYYKIYGRRLEFEEGEVTLTGGTSLDPVVNFIMAYKFRDPDQMMRKLSVNVSGRVSKPELKFYLDDTAIEEKEAISYLLFNKNTNQLDSRENSLANKSNLDVAKDLTIGQISNKVQDVLQSSIGLDVIEISGEDGWSQGSVSVGKYISNNLFLNYERTFTLDKKDKIIEPQKISLEYQIYRALFLQATNQSTNSGFDFMLKWTWK